MGINPFQDSEVPVANDKYPDGLKPFVDGIDNDVYGPGVDHDKKTTIHHGDPQNFGRPVPGVGADGRPTVYIPYETVDTVQTQPGFWGRLMGETTSTEKVVVKHGDDVRSWVK